MRTRLFKVIAVGACAVTTGATGVAHAQSDVYTGLLQQPGYQTVRYYPLGSIQSGTSADVLGHGAATIVGAPAVVNGPLFEIAPGGNGGGGLAIDGLGQHGLVEAPEFASAFNTPEGASVVIWFRAFEDSRGGIVGTFNEGRKNGFQILLGANPSFYLANQFQLVFSVNFSSGDFVSCAGFSTDWTNGDWHMIAGTYRQGVAKVYIDGEATRWAVAEPGGVGRVEALTNAIALGGVNDGTINTRKTSQLSNFSLHTTELTLEQVRALWHAANGYTGQSVYNGAAVRPWLIAAMNQRVDAALVGDSNVLFGAQNAEGFGHQYGMAQGLRNVLPFYAGPVMGGVGFGAWVNRLNGVTNFLTSVSLPTSAPGFIESKVPPESFGFLVRAMYGDEQTVIPGTDVFRGVVAWESPDFLYDFRRGIDWHLTYARFAAGGAGVMRPGVRLSNAPYTALAEATISSAGVQDEIASTVVPIPAGAREAGKTYSLQVTDLGSGLGAQGPLGLLYHRMVVSDQLHGVSMTPLWAAGGQSARFAADMFVNYTSLEQIAEFLHQMVRHQPTGQERLLVQIIEGGNDTNDFRLAVNVDGSLANVGSQSAKGQKLNMLTVMSRVKAAWESRGYDATRLCFLLGPYHPSPTSGPRLRSVYVRGWRELARDNPALNITVMDGFGFTSVEEFYANGWYNLNNSDVAHLAKSGYLNFGVKTWQRLVQDVLPGPILSGACCDGGTCSQMIASECTGALRRYAGVGTVCSPGFVSRQPCCRADFNHDRAVTVQDVFEYLNAYFAGDVRADMMNYGTVAPTIGSVFVFLDEWFEGC